MPNLDRSVACDCGHPQPEQDVGHRLVCAMLDRRLAHLSRDDRARIDAVMDGLEGLADDGWTGTVAITPPAAGRKETDRER
ncbi:hypothetical protein PV350_04795 [Streptomyces sp. PA03-6a]|nr:hypothetical protein [Streptomyces sp. PA03-6a]